MDRQLNHSQQAKLEAHLQACEACQHELESLRATVGLLHLTPMVEAPRSFVLRPQQDIRPRLKFQGVMRWSTALAAALLLIVLAGDGLSSFALRASPAAPPGAPGPAGMRASAPENEATGGAAPPSARSQSAPAQSLTPVPNKAAPSDSATTSQFAPQAPLSASPPSRDGEGVGRTEAETRPASPAEKPGLSRAPGLTGFRTAEIALVCVIAILFMAGFLAPRVERRGRGRRQ